MKGITGNPALDAYNRMAVTPVGAARPVERADAPSSPSTESAAAEVKISARARDLATEAGQGTVDAQKVEALKQKIAEGALQIDPRVIASHMIDQLG